jgi:hypothetical protein
MISQEALNEYKQIHLEEFGYTPSDDILIAQATALLSLTRVIHRKIKHEWLSRYSNRNKAISEQEIIIAVFKIYIRPEVLARMKSNYEARQKVAPGQF